MALKQGLRDSLPIRATIIAELQNVFLCFLSFIVVDVLFCFTRKLGISYHGTIVILCDL